MHGHWMGAKDCTSYEGHPFLEASSIRLIGDWCHFVYSSFQGNEPPQTVAYVLIDTQSSWCQASSPSATR